MEYGKTGSVRLAILLQACAQQKVAVGQYRQTCHSNTVDVTHYFELGNIPIKVMDST